MLPRYKVFKRAANVFLAVDLGFPILLTRSGRSRVAVRIILRKGPGLYRRDFLVWEEVAREPRSLGRGARRLPGLLQQTPYSAPQRPP